jgi:putative ABC transport system permease protein
MAGRSREWGRLRRIFRLPSSRARIAADVYEEIQFHIEERIEQLLATGMSREQARAEVLKRFGDVESYQMMTRQIDEETMRNRSRFELLSTLARETRRSARVLVRTPAFSLIAFITLALGVGATTAVFTVLDAVVLRPLPYANPEELVSVLHPATVPGSGERKWGLSEGGYFFFAENNTSFSSFGMYRTHGAIVEVDGSAETARAGRVTPTVFDVLGARARLGRLFTIDDARPDSSRRIVLSHEYWTHRFGGDPAIVGKMLRTSGGSYEVVGVVEPGLTLPMPGPFASAANLAGFGVDIWFPLKLNPAGPFYNSHPHVGLGRLKPGVTVADANRDIAALTRRLPEVVPNAYTNAFIKDYNFRGEAAPLRDAVLGPTVPKTLWALFGSVLLVLMIAAANVANLFLVRMDARRRESAIRTALGADRAQMATHYLSESLILAIAGGIAGVLIANAGLRGLLAIAPTSIPRLAQVTLSWQSVVFALGVAVLLGAIFGVMPLLRRRLDLAILREGGRGSTASPRQRAVRGALVVGQVAFALMLLAAAGLMLRTFANLRNVRPGFDVTNVLAFQFSLPIREFDTREKALVFHRELQNRVAAIPGVQSVGATDWVPLADYGTGCAVVFRENRPYRSGEEPPCVSVPTALPGFFETMKMRVEGHIPDWSDVDALTQPAVVTRALAERLWPGEDPIGKGIGSNGWDSKVWYRVVGVVPEIRAEALDRPATEAVFYAPTPLFPNRRSDALNYPTFMVRTSGVNPESLMPAIRRLLNEMNPRIPVTEARSMQHVMERSIARTSFLMTLLGIAATLALVLSAVGLYGVISYIVGQRTSEIGVRIALGARVAEVARLVMLQSVKLTAVGIAIGIVGAYGATKALQSLLFGVTATDPVVFASAAVVLLVVAGAASVAPARRAARIDPVEALRSE